MANKHEESIYALLSSEPVTPNEVARRLGIAYKTAQRALMHLALTKRDVAYRNSGRIHIFWKKPVKEG